MKQSRTAPWIAGTVLISLLMAAGFWFLLIAPARAETGEMNEQAESEAQRADQLTMELTGLKKDFANIETFRSDLAELSTQIPASADLANLTRQIQERATETGVFITEYAPGTPLPVVQPTATAPTADPSAPAADGTTGSGSTDAAAPAGAAPAAPAAPAGPAGFYAVPVNVTVLGSFDATVQFIDRLSTGGGRLVVVNSVQATGQKASAAENGRPAVNEGDLQTVVQTWAFVLQDPATAGTGTDGAAAPTDPTAAPQLPVPGGQGNPFGPSN